MFLRLIHKLEKVILSIRTNQAEVDSCKDNKDEDIYELMDYGYLKRKFYKFYLSKNLRNTSEL